MPLWDGNRTWSPKQLEDARRQREAAAAPKAASKPSNLADIAASAKTTPSQVLTESLRTSASAPKAAVVLPKFDPSKVKGLEVPKSSALDDIIKTVTETPKPVKPGTPSMLDAGAKTSASSKPDTSRDIATNTVVQRLLQSGNLTPRAGQTLSPEQSAQAQREALTAAVPEEDSSWADITALLDKKTFATGATLDGITMDDVDTLIDKQMARNQRRTSLGLLGEGVHGPVEVQNNEAKPMSWKEFDGLKPKQKAAVDFNTALVKAVGKDLKLQDHYKKNPVGEDNQKQYDNLTEDIFGEGSKEAGRGSDTYAPQTMALLQSIGYKDSNADLDDFLDLRTAIRAEDLQNVDLQGYDNDPGVDPDGSGTAKRDMAPTNPGSRTDLMGKLALGTEELKKKFAAGKSMETFQDQLRREIYDKGAAYGVKMNFKQPVVGLGTGGKELNDPNSGETFFKTIYDELANLSDEDVKWNLSTFTEEPFQKNGVTMNDFWTYADARLRNTNDFKDYGSTVGSKGPGRARTPQQFRALLGLERNKEK